MRSRPVPLRYNGKNVLVVGMGPAGYTLAHYLLNEGFGVVGIDGLRIEPLATDVRGSRKRVPRPIQNINDIWQSSTSAPFSDLAGFPNTASPSGGTRTFWTSTIWS